MAGPGLRKGMAAWVMMVAAIAPAAARAAPFEVGHATALYLAMLGPAAQARSDAYFDGGVWIDIASGLLTVLVCWVTMRSEVLVRVRDALRRQGWRPWVVMTVVAMLFLACLIVLQLPWTIATGFLRERQFGLMNQAFGSWLGDQALAALGLIVAGGLALTVINQAMRQFPRTWWLVGAGVSGLLFALGALVTPVFIMPIFNTYTELPAGPLRARVASMAQAHAIPSDHILVFDGSRQSDRLSANVAGVGPTVRISLTDNLVRRTSVPVAAAVVGHEIGHYVAGDVWRAIAAMTGLTALELGLLAKFGPMTLARGGRRRAVRALDDPAALPVLIGGLSLLSLLFLPVANMLTRNRESAADAFGLDAARAPDGFAQAAMLLSNYRKISPPAWEEALFYDHPSGRTRVTMAMQWKKDHVPGAVAVVPPPIPPVPTPDQTGH